MLSFLIIQLDDPSDKEIFVEFYITYRQLMYRAAFKVLKKKHLAEDAVQDSFLSITKHIKKLRGMDQNQQMGFAVLVARNKAIDLFRKERQIKYLADMDEDTLLTELEIDDSNHIFNQLPYQYSYVLKLVGFGFKPAEIAEMTNREVATVYKQIARGKAILSEILEKEGYRGY